MFKRNLVIGGLVAGAFLLPSLAVAGGSVSGPCVNCHTMHNSQNGAQVHTGEFANLLGGTGCTGCHAVSGLENDAAAGVPLTGAKAPQVDNNGTSGQILNGGYFTLGNGANANQHNVVGVSSTDGAFANPLLPPGGAALASQLQCANCHTSSGHHSPAANKYRMLAGTGRTVKNTKYGAKAGAAGVTAGVRSTVLYNATDMNLFCAKCHGGFHGGAQGGPDTWLRHPTDVKVINSTTYPSIVTLLPATIPAGAVDKVVLGSTAAIPTQTVQATDATVMCISCHVPHGGPYADLLSFNYTANQAGGVTAADGCETCHSYGGAGM